MPFNNQEKINAAEKLTQQIVGRANDAPGTQWWYNESLPLNMWGTPDKIMTELALIPGAVNPTEADAAEAAVPAIIQKTVSRLTLEITSNNRAYLCRSTFGDPSSPIESNHLQPSFVRTNGEPSNGFIARLFHGDPGAGGVELPTSYHAGAGGSPAWSFLYYAGMLLVSTDEAAHFASLYNANGLYIQTFRYIGKTLDGAAGSGNVVGATRTFTQADLSSGVLTFAHNLTAEDEILHVTIKTNNNKKIEVDDILYVDENVVQANLGMITPITGLWTILVTCLQGTIIPPVSLSYRRFLNGPTINQITLN